jgi:hypothetical protein
MEINLKLHAQDVQVVLNVLGQQPTSTGLYPLVMLIKNQAEAQLAQTPAPVEAVMDAESEV